MPARPFGPAGRPNLAARSRGRVGGRDLSHLGALDAADPADTELAHPVRAHPGPPNATVRNLAVGTLIAFVVASYVGNLFLSVLVNERPLLFIALNAQNRNLALASGELGALEFYVVGCWGKRSRSCDTRPGRRCRRCSRRLRRQPMPAKKTATRRLRRCRS